MTDKELVFEMYQTASSYYKTSNIPEYFYEAYDTVVKSLNKYDIEENDIRNDTVKDSDWKKIIHQIIYDLSYAWSVSSDYGEADDVIGLSNLCMDLATTVNQKGEGYDFVRNKMSKTVYDELREEHGLK